jgi:hypothetical protein
MEATCSSETSVDFQQTTRRHIPEGRTVHNYRWEEFKSYVLCIIFIKYVNLTRKLGILFSCQSIHPNVILQTT